MMKKRKNMQFFAAAALTATLITGQFTYVPVMAGSTAEVEVSSLIPDNVTVEQPVPLSEISLPKSDYGTLSWVDSSSVPSKRVQSYDVVFHPYNTADLAKFSGWDGQSDAIYSSVTVVVSSFSKDTDYTDNGYENQDSQETQENGNTGENGEDTTTETPGSTEISDNGEVKDESEAKDQYTPDTAGGDIDAAIQWTRLRIQQKHLTIKTFQLTLRKKIPQMRQKHQKLQLHRMMQRIRK